LSHLPRLSVTFEDGRVDAGAGALLAQAMRDEIAALYDGLELDGEDMPRAGPTELSPPGGAFLIGLADGKAVCCGGIKRLDAQVCEIKKMFVVPEVRGRGVARALLHGLERRAIELGYTTARLDTGPRQVNARGLYEAEGYREIENFNGNPVATFWGEKSMLEAS
jgi:GNAT superfamily N-acetyltransferase